MWLLLFALPMQGYAAVTMLGCGPNHHRMSVEVVAEHRGQHEHSPAAGHHHPHEHQTAAADAVADASSGDAADGTSSVHHLDKVSKFKCSACAACCVGAALPSAAFVFASAAPNDAPSASFSIGPVGFLTDGPERPPRISLA
ncbi:MAG: hypothetical protein QFE16_03030 [Pseudomonadota bacterium]|nr:hypothetical protein [Pseudomonadota bacterium]